MRADELDRQLRKAYLDNSLHETSRDYLGMSGAGECPRSWYWRTVDPIRDERMTWYAFTGYMHEFRLLELLGVKQVRRSLVADFDNRYRGHTDHELPDGTLLEFKSVSWERYLKLFADGKGDWKNRSQCQAYMRHGIFPHAVLIYVARDIPWYAFDFSSPKPFFTIDVWRHEGWMDELDEKAKMVLACIDKGEPPECTCRYCKR